MNGTRAARARARQRRPEALALARMLRAAETQPAAAYYCPKTNSGGRGGCLMLAMYATPDGPLLWWPALDHGESSPLGKLRGAEKREEGAELLVDMVASAGDLDLLGGIVECRHYAASVTVEQLVADVQAAVGRVVLAADAPGAAYILGPAHRDTL